MPFDFDPSRDRLPAGPPEAPPAHPADAALPVFDWAAPGQGSTDPTQLLRLAPPASADEATPIPPAASPASAPPGPPTAAWPSPPSFPPASPPPAPLPSGGAWATTREQPAAPTPTRTRSARTTLLVLVAVAALVASAFVGAGAREWLSTSSTTATPTPSTDGTLSDTAGGAEKPSTGSGPNGSGSAATGAPPDWSAVADAIVPGVVDIEARVSGGVAAGTGMVLSESGEILTNNHVVEGARQIVVTVVSTGEEYSASIVGTDPAEDVAVLQLADASGLTTIPLGDSDEVEVADPIAAIGNAGGVGGPPDVAIGKVVALHQQITAGDQHGNDTETLVDMIQVDAEVVAGDSGGPLADAAGEVVGMNTAAASSNGSLRATVNQAFAIPINRALSIAEQLASGSSNRSSGDPGNGSGSSPSNRGFLGVEVQTGTAGGAEVVGVVTGSAAAEAGVEAGDVIVGLDGAPVTTADDLTAALQSSASGDRVQLTWQASDGRMRRATVELQAA
jgi:S1-C subfamily serine protease